jgi:DNA topoisomerase I
MKLVIVESPTKAKKLSAFLGSEYSVLASVGHVRDLPKKALGVDIEKNFEPTYEVDPEKKAVVSKIKDLAKSAQEIFLATDPDREGEAIAWHLGHLISKEGIRDPRFKRATFHEITKSAVVNAMEHPGKISLDLVDAQQARRVVDRLVGYQVSPVLWKKVRRGLSAGRVQSVALRMIVEREREIEAFKPEEYWEVDVLLSTSLDENNRLKPEAVVIAAEKWAEEKPKWFNELHKDQLVGRVTEVQGKAFNPTKQEDSKWVVENAAACLYAVTSVEQKTRERSSLPPFTTSTLQQAAATRLGFTSKQTMTLAQQLYEEGLITYHRTDSVSLSQQAIEMARQYIQATFGDKYLPGKPRYFSTKSKNAQEAHEAIRVTDAAKDPEKIYAESSRFTDRHAKLYDLIRKRYVASQMTAAVYQQTAVMIGAYKDQAHVNISKHKPDFSLKANGSVLSFDGWVKLFSNNEDTLLPAVEVGQELGFGQLAAAQKFTQPPPRYNDASLVKELEKRGIGRPSTYASIISVIEDRGYVDRLDKRFIATTTGMTVSDFLKDNFPVFMEYDFTAEMEEDLDRISRGEKAWKKVVKDFYTPLSKTIDTVVEKADRVAIPVEETGEPCPLCHAESGGMVVIRSGRFGKFKSCSRFPECKFTENIVEKLPDRVCPLCQQGEIIIKNTRWGKPFYGCARYPDCDWAAWYPPAPGLKITQKEWEEQKAERERRKAERAATFAAKGAKKSSKSTKGKDTKSKAVKKSKKASTTKKKAK